MLIKLHILVKPNAKQTTIVKIVDQVLHVSLHAKPVQGEANKALIAFLSKQFKIPLKDIILEKGKASRYKVVILPKTQQLELILQKQDDGI